MPVSHITFGKGGSQRIPILNRSAVVWALTEGTEPYIGTFDIVPEHADLLTEVAALQQGQFTLEMSSNHGDIKFEKLSVLTDSPGEDPHIKRILLADRRWVWAYRWVLERYNMRRRVGNTIRSPNRDVPDQIRAISNEIQFAKYSLREEKKVWGAFQALEDILTSPQALGQRGDGSKTDSLFLTLDDIITDAAGVGLIDLAGVGGFGSITL